MMSTREPPIEMRVCHYEIHLRGLGHGATREGGFCNGRPSFQWGLMVLACSTAAAAPPPSYSRQVQPLFQRRCMPCHDAVTRTSGLALDSFAALRRGGKG